jgi:Zn-dependent protease
VRGFLRPPGEGVFEGRTNDNFELLKAWAGTSLAFAIAQVGITNLFGSRFIEILLISGVVCGLGFVLHELAHRIVARAYGAQAHFVADDRWLIMSIVIALAGFFIAAPGAVWHRGRLTVAQGGQIALAGPATNMALSVLFILLLPVGVLAGFQEDWFFTLCLVGVGLNAWLGLFNMLPAGPFDGAKVLAWNPVIFGITVVIGIVLTFVIGRTETLISIWETMFSMLGR